MALIFDVSKSFKSLLKRFISIVLTLSSQPAVLSFYDLYNGVTRAQITCNHNANLCQEFEFQVWQSSVGLKWVTVRVFPRAERAAARWRPSWGWRCTRRPPQGTTTPWRSSSTPASMTLTLAMRTGATRLLSTGHVSEVRVLPLVLYLSV